MCLVLNYVYVLKQNHITASIAIKQLFPIHINQLKVAQKCLEQYRSPLLHNGV